MKIRVLLVLLSLVLTSNLTIAQENASKPAAAVKEVTLDEAEKLIQSNTNIVILDVRTRREFASGRLAGAKNLDFYAPDFEQKLSQMDKSKPYLIHCATGGRSAEARDKMKELGFQNLYHMDGGFRAWQKAGKKAEKD
ncbi:MAG: rhodanese-like domain-containing protein [Limisphaerales bacterium]